MKKIIPIFLIVIICINHLNIVDAIMHFKAVYKKANTETVKNFPAEEKSEPEKENAGKEKSEEQEKFYSRNSNLITTQSQLSDRDKFICYTTRLNAHPYQDDDIQPPKAS